MGRASSVQIERRVINNLTLHDNLRDRAFQSRAARMMDTSTSVPLMMDIEGGEENLDPKSRLEDDFAYHNNVAGASKHVRLGFMRKVQLSITTLIGAVFLFTPVFK